MMGGMGGMQNVYGMGVVLGAKNYAGSVMRGASRDFNRLLKNAKMTDAEVDRAQRGVQRGMKLIGVGAAGMAGEIKAAMAYAPFESLERDLVSAGVTAADAHRLVFEETRKVAALPWVTTGTDEMAQSLYDLKNAARQVEGMDAVIRAVAATTHATPGTAWMDAADLFMAALPNYKRGWKDYEEGVRSVSDWTALAGSEFGTNVGNMIGGIKKASPSMVAANQTFGDTALAVAALNDYGRMMNEEAGTALMAFARDLLRVQANLEKFGETKSYFKDFAFVEVDPDTGKKVFKDVVSIVDEIVRMMKLKPGQAIDVRKLMFLGAGEGIDAETLGFTEESMKALKALVLGLEDMQRVRGKMKVGIAESLALERIEGTVLKVNADMIGRATDAAVDLGATLKDPAIDKMEKAAAAAEWSSGMMQKHTWIGKALDYAAMAASVVGLEELVRHGSKRFRGGKGTAAEGEEGADVDLSEVGAKGYVLTRMAKWARGLWAAKSAATTAATAAEVAATTTEVAAVTTATGGTVAATIGGVALQGSIAAAIMAGFVAVGHQIAESARAKSVEELGYVPEEWDIKTRGVQQSPEYLQQLEAFLNLPPEQSAGQSAAQPVIQLEQKLEFNITGQTSADQDTLVDKIKTVLNKETALAMLQGLFEMGAAE